MPPNKLVSPPKWKRLKPLISDQQSLILDMILEGDRQRKSLAASELGPLTSFTHSPLCPLLRSWGFFLIIILRIHDHARMIAELMRRMPHYCCGSSRIVVAADSSSYPGNKAVQAAHGM